MHYRQPILLFGLILPLLACGAVAGGLLYIHKNMAASFASTQKQYQAAQLSKRNAEAADKQVSAKRAFYTEWQKLLAKETKSEVSNHLRKIQDSLPAKEFQQTSADSLTGAGGFASASTQKSSQLRLGFRGTYRALQRAFLELETRMPQLQLQEFRMDANTNQTSLSNVDVTYTAWETDAPAKP
jgi:hypothetical protein